MSTSTPLSSPTRLNFLSANVQSFKSDSKLEESILSMKSGKIYAAAIQETWRSGSENLNLRGFTFLCHGLPSQSCNRGSAGVAIILSMEAKTAWEKANCEIHNDLGPRIIAIRMCTSSTNSIFLISAYAPTSTSSESDWNEFFDNLAKCVKRKNRNDILLIGADCNSSIGTNQLQHHPGYDSIGKFGLQHRNDSGTRFLHFLQQNNLAAITTFFKKPIHKYVTWISPTGDIYQIDHFLCLKFQLKLFTDASTGHNLVKSDHTPIFCKIKLPTSPTHIPAQAPSSRPRALHRKDFSTLKNNTEIKNSFINRVTTSLPTTQSNDAQSNYSSLTSAILSAMEIIPKKNNRLS